MWRATFNQIKLQTTLLGDTDIYFRDFFLRSCHAVARLFPNLIDRFETLSRPENKNDTKLNCRRSNYILICSSLPQFLWHTITLLLICLARTSLEGKGQRGKRCPEDWCWWRESLRPLSSSLQATCSGCFARWLCSRTPADISFRDGKIKHFYWHCCQERIRYTKRLQV